MRATIRAADPDSTASVRVDGETPVRVYRIPERTEEVVADKDGEVTPFGVRDISVSREHDDDGNPGYIEFFREDKQLYVRDSGSSSGAVQRNAFTEIGLSDGEPSLITGDCQVEIGYSTELEVEVEEANRPESRVPDKADLVAKISHYRTANEVQSELIELRDLMREESNSGEQYQQRLDDIESALTGIRNLGLDADYDNSLPEQGYKEVAQNIQYASRRVKNYYLNS
jgi:hypothetical protein